MIDEKKIARYNMEMPELADGATHYLGALIGGGFVIRKLASDMVDYVLAQTKRSIESCPSSSQEEKATVNVIRNA